MSRWLVVFGCFMCAVCVGASRREEETAETENPEALAETGRSEQPQPLDEDLELSLSLRAKAAETLEPGSIIDGRFRLVEKIHEFGASRQFKQLPDPFDQLHSTEEGQWPLWPATLDLKALQERGRGSASFNYPLAFRRDNYTPYKRLGKGAFGEVWRAVALDGVHGYKLVVLKRLLVEIGGERVRLSGEREIYFGELFRGAPHVSRFLDWFVKPASGRSSWANGKEKNKKKRATGKKTKGMSGKKNQQENSTENLSLQRSDGGSWMRWMPSFSFSFSFSFSSFLPVPSVPSLPALPSFPRLLQLGPSFSSSSVPESMLRLLPFRETFTGLVPAPLKAWWNQQRVVNGGHGQMIERRSGWAAEREGWGANSEGSRKQTPPGDTGSPFEGEEDDDLWLVFADEGNSLYNQIFVAEEAKGGALSRSSFWWSLKSSPFGQQVFRQIARQTLEGLALLHSRNVTHRDVKLANLLISTPKGRLSIRLADFGSAVQRTREGPVNLHVASLYGQVGPSEDEETEGYRSPEALFPEFYLGQGGQHSYSSASSSSGEDGTVDGGGFEEEGESFKGRENVMGSLEEEEEGGHSGWRQPSYDLWSLGVVLLEIVLGEIGVFEMGDERKRAKIEKLLEDDERLRQHVLFLHALQEMCLGPLPAMPLHERPRWRQSRDKKREEGNNGNEGQQQEGGLESDTGESSLSLSRRARTAEREDTESSSENEKWEGDDGDVVSFEPSKDYRASKQSGDWGDLNENDEWPAAGKEIESSPAAASASSTSVCATEGPVNRVGEESPAPTEMTADESVCIFQGEPMTIAWADHGGDSNSGNVVTIVSAERYGSAPQCTEREGSGFPDPSLVVSETDTAFMSSSSAPGLTLSWQDFEEEDGGLLFLPDSPRTQHSFSSSSNTQQSGRSRGEGTDVTPLPLSGRNFRPVLPAGASSFLEMKSSTSISPSKSPVSLDESAMKDPKETKRFELEGGEEDRGGQAGDEGGTTTRGRGGPKMEVPKHCSDPQFAEALRSRDPSGVGLPVSLARDLLRKLLEVQPQKRITAKQALEHPYFSLTDEELRWMASEELAVAHAASSA
uniref:Protein kinase domain-containing protein n=1 Tax=Chromera velia CCMP2878 TaxID=1169474 RepID=A0A0G4FN13_9ALVE|eukprot:Cvel_3543.t1-p1 / transcript=Cvel_3543.t1 / gene=Cvel_3543 / organism=Chromera_velia_CCMP2878 / gene_product=Probable inactive protein kinase At3g63330, putative / transcript_product=Probable inactive protein kinase At3g63330, putative / location=Cvel_scaffold144:86520-93518(+) / protein_length=1075 / sequence_SO=supercontig / SO=protein_coding / is_pseudo=false